MLTTDKHSEYAKSRYSVRGHIGKVECFLCSYANTALLKVINLATLHCFIYKFTKIKGQVISLYYCLFERKNKVKIQLLGPWIHDRKAKQKTKISVLVWSIQI